MQKNKFQVDTAQFATDKQTSFKSLEYRNLKALKILIFIPMKQTKKIQTQTDTLLQNVSFASFKLMTLKFKNKV